MVSDLIAKLCDEQTPESLRLSNEQIAELLRSDPTAIDEYLDHMYLSGLLEQELGRHGGQPVQLATKQTSWDLASSLSLLAVAAAILLLCGIGWMFTDKSNWGASDIVDVRRDGFESDLHLELMHSPNNWHGDHAKVVGDWMGVQAPEGGKMLRLVRSSTAPETSCDIFHVVNLGHLEEYQIGSSPKLDASYIFNSLDEHGDGDYVFSLSLYSFPMDPLAHGRLLPLPIEEALAFMTRQVAADSDVFSWQKLGTEIMLPEDTQFVVLQISVRHRERGGSEFEYPGQLIDDVQMKLTMQ